MSAAKGDTVKNYCMSLTTLYLLVWSVSQHHTHYCENTSFLNMYLLNDITSIYTHCISKNVPTLASCNFNKHRLILTIFNRQHQHTFKNDMCIQLSLSFHFYFLLAFNKPTGEHTCFAGTATVNRSPHRHSSRCWLEGPPGRPRRNWLQQLEEDTGLSVGAAWIAGQDRSMWRMLRPSAGQAQQWVSEISF